MPLNHKISTAQGFIILDPILHLRGFCCPEFRLFKFLAYCFVNNTAENIAFEEKEVETHLLGSLVPVILFTTVCTYVRVMEVQM
jgi:hypothetical protein